LQGLFWESLNVDYVEIAYREFDLNLTIITKALIEKVQHTLQYTLKISLTKICYIIHLRYRHQIFGI
jgi:hypothetical protein